MDRNKLSKFAIILALAVTAASPSLVYAQADPISGYQTPTIPGITPPNTKPPVLATTKPATTSNTTQSATADLPIYNGGVDQSIRDYLCAPSEESDGLDLVRCVNRLYKFGVTAGALLLVFFVVYSGYLYIVGGQGGKEQAKKIIPNTLTGMAVLLGSYVLLYFINPNLVVFKPIQPPIFEAKGLPSCEEIGFGKACLTASGEFGVSTGDGGAIPTGDPGKLPPGGKCLKNACPSPSSYSPPLADLKSSGAVFKNASFADPSVVDKMKALKDYLDKNGGPPLRVTEAYPPSTHHESTCHYNGRCFDISPANKTVDAFNRYCKALKAVGINSFLNEASNEATECGKAKKTKFGNGAHIHINTFK